MKCSMTRLKVDSAPQPCENIAVVIPTIELRAAWNSEILPAPLPRMATCFECMCNVSLVSVLRAISFPAFIDAAKQIGKIPPSREFSTLCWTPIDPDFQPEDLTRDNVAVNNDTGRVSRIIMPGDKIDG